MSKSFQFLFVLASLTTISSAQTITQNFGAGANAFSIDFVTIGNPGNAADTTGTPNPAGSVAYTYNIGKYEVSRDMVLKASTAGGLGLTLQDMSSYGTNGGSFPATGVSWYEAARFVNWLNTSTGGTAAYKFVGGAFTLWSAGDAGYNANNKFRNSLAKIVLPSTDEWYKAAYGSPIGTWYNYPTGSDTAPTPVTGGTAVNTAVYKPQNAPAEVTNAGGLSQFGTMAQGGNVMEWIETAFDGSNDLVDEARAMRGGSWYSYTDLNSRDLAASYSGSLSPTNEGLHVAGFRVAMIPEPSSLSLLVLGGVVVMAGRRRNCGNEDS